MTIKQIAVLGGRNGALTDAVVVSALAVQPRVGGVAPQKEVPIARSLLTLIGAIVGEDFTETGRTLNNLGLPN